MLIPPRLNRLLQILLESGEPIPVNRLAEKLGVSRRTVFREMENISALLEPYGLETTAKAGEGIRLEGPEEGQKELLEELRAETPEPSDKRGRLLSLTLELLRNPEVQKIYYYAGRFKVSEGTISNDLETAAGWLDGYRLKLSRRQGLGISVEGEEADFRRALIRLLEQHAAGELDRLARDGFLGPGILEEVCAILRGIHDPQYEQMTEDSQSRLAIYLAVVAERIRAGRTLFDDAPEEPPGPLAERLADAMEEGFSIILSGAERACLTVQISGARVKYIDERQEAELLMDHFEIQRLAYRMIDRFDSEMAYELKMDEALVKGLTFHLRSAVVRLRHGLELQDPMLGQMEQSYPEVFEKSRQAAGVLTEEYGRQVSDSEAGFLSMHFGAAVIRLRERKTHKRTVHIGVLCVNGIGVSYMMASQIKACFKNDVEVEVCIREDLEQQGRFDFCVSSIPFVSERLPVIETQPILTEQDLEKIRQEITHRAYLRENAQQRLSTHDFDEHLQRIEWLVHDIRVLLEKFHAVEVGTGSSFRDLVKLAGYHFGNSPEKGKTIYNDLMARERVSTQVVAEYGFVLLHARTRGVTDPVFALLRPERIPFSDPYLQGVHTAVMMLAPISGRPDQGKLMGAISSALIEDNCFLQTVRAGDSARVRVKLEGILRGFLAENMKQLIGSM